MGSLQGDADERPIHEVVFDRAFGMQAFEVTVGEYRRFVEATGREHAGGCRHYPAGEARVDPARSWQAPGFEQTDRHPVTCVSHDDAEAYAAWLSARNGRRFRLPTEAEWEYAASLPDGATWPWTRPADACQWANLTDLSRALWHWRGDENFLNPALYRRLEDQLVPCDDRFVFTAPVGSFRDIRGVHDLLGNVWEWVADCAGAESGAVPAYPQSRSDARAVVETPCVRRGIRGGAWHTGAPYARITNRSSVAGDARMYHLGFRLVEDLFAAKEVSR